MDPCNSSVGTIAYMSPERINTDLNHGRYNGYAGDVWSLGVSILEFYLGGFLSLVILRRDGPRNSFCSILSYSDHPELRISESDNLTNAS
ncbi:hypothetical protein Bca52824_095042 [Brassica carinata]|uniref:Protein kinase domain-containing protein n=1 Tax=Brassica carinata TaxID=52824 RepID=A0A8X7NZM2_BRACI|nr:hypothetical protein Bca52824_095042 [Brassica carinata]